MPPFPLGQCPLPPPNLVIEDAKLIYQPNFEGREGRFNKAGERGFNVRIPDNILDAVMADNWNVKWTKPKSDEFQPEPYIEVAIGFTYRPPQISIWEAGQETRLIVDQNAGIDTVKLVDSMEFEKIDLVLRGRAWENESGCGIKAWLKTFVGVVETDEIRAKYAAMRDHANA